MRLPLICKAVSVYAPGVIVLPPPSSTPVTVPLRTTANALDADVIAAVEVPPRTRDPENVNGPVIAELRPLLRN